MDGFYNNSGYINNRNRKKTLIINLDDSDNTHLGSGTEFKINLTEPLIIDKHSEIFLDNFITFNCNLGDTPNNSAFALKINEFNINTGVASNTSSDKIERSVIIPNDNNDINNYFGAVVHKTKKFNYICDINPCTLSSISGKITDLNGEPIFHGSSTGTKFTYALVGIDSWTFMGGAARSLIKGDVVTSIIPTGSSISAGGSTRILTNTIHNANTIFFTAEEELIPTEWAGVDIDFIVSNSLGYGTYTFKISTATNKNIILLKEHSRFIAEFTINSCE